MLSNDINAQKSEIEYAKYLWNVGYIPRSQQFVCGNNNFEIYNDSYNKTSGCSYRCLNSKCRRKYSVRINSFYNLFPYVSLKVISEIIKSFLCIELNTEAVYQYLRHKNISISKREIYNIYKAMRNYIQKYLLVVYNSENISKKTTLKS